MLNNIEYEINVEYIDKTGKNISISHKMNDQGSEIKTIKIEDQTLTEETLNGRRVSASFNSKDEKCGFRFNYEEEDPDKYLVSLTKDKTPEQAADIISHKTSVGSVFNEPRYILSPIQEGSLKIVMLESGEINVTRTVSAQNENSDNYLYKECVCLSKTNPEEECVEKSKASLYQINDIKVEEAVNIQTVETEQNNEGNTEGMSLEEISDIKSKLDCLVKVAMANPKGYKKLQETIATAQKPEEVPAQ